jgi:hypothetical protein
MIRFIVKGKGYSSHALRRCIGMRLMGEEGLLNFHEALAFCDDEEQSDITTQEAINIYETLNVEDPDFDINYGYKGYTIDFLDEMKIRRVTEEDKKK